MATTDVAPVPITCPACRGWLDSEVDVCPRCGAATAEPNAPDLPDLVEPVRPPIPIGSYGLDTLLLATALVGLWTGSIAMHPWFGVIVLAMTVPGFVRTWRIIAARKREGRATSVLQKVSLFLESTTVSLWLLPGLMIAALLLGVLVGLLIACFGML